MSARPGSRLRAAIAGLMLCIGCSPWAEGTAQTTASAFWGELELGAGAVSEDSFKFGEYTGLEDSGAFVVAGIDVSSAFEFDDETADYWSLTGTNLGLESRSVNAEFGTQGRYSAYVRYRNQPHYRLDGVRTPFLGAGTANQSLPPNWVAANTTDGLRNLFAMLDHRRIKTERDQYGGGLSWLFAKDWELSGQYQHETKDGQDAIGAIFGTNGGNPRGAILVAPIDYTTDAANISLAYGGRDVQVSLAYHLSFFRAEDEALSWDNPFLRLPFGNTWAPGTDFASGVRGRLALAPDNQAHRIAFTGGYRLGTRTRLTANVSRGWMIQDEEFLPYTSNPNLTVVAGLPRANLDGRIETTYVNLGLSTRPARKLDIRANYVYDERDNETPRDIYRLVVNDSANQDALVSSSARVNTPYSFSTHRFAVEAGYRVLPRSKLTFGYEFEHRDRDFSEVANTDEHTAQVKLWSAFGAAVSGWVAYERAERNGSSYVSNRPFLDGHNAAYVATLAPQAQFINDPLLRKYNYADRDRDGISGTVNLVPAEALVVSINGRYGHDDYERSRLGLQNRRDASVTLDTAFTPSKSLSMYAFVTHERLEYEQGGYQRAAVALFPGFARQPPPCGSCGFWSVETDDEINTVGTGAKWSGIDGKLSLKFDYTYSGSETETTPGAEPSVMFLPLPALVSTLHRINLTGEYAVSRNLAIRLRYIFEHLNVDDFAANGLQPNTLSNIISLGGRSFDYDTHVVGLSFVYRMQ